MDRVILLIHGEPCHGKSYLGRLLRDRFGFEVLDLDDEYVDFTRTRCPDLYFNWLRAFIAPQYISIARQSEWTKEHFGRDIVREWHAYLLEKIASTSKLSPRLAVVGWLLFDCKDDFETPLSRDALVVQVHVRDRVYFTEGGPVTAEHLGGLGMSRSSRIRIEPHAAREQPE
jgi:hypothetical protein